MKRVGRRRPMPSGITAAAARVRIERGIPEITVRQWQKRMWEYYRRIPEIRYGTNFQRHAATKAEYFPARRTDPNSDPEPIDSGPAYEAFLDMHENSMGINQLIGELVLHWQVPGEAWVHGDVSENWWDVFSTEEVQTARGDTWISIGDKERRQLSDDDVFQRLWRPNPEKGWLPDSPLYSVQEQCEELLLLSQQIRAVAQSRIPAGMLLMPEELSIVRSEKLDPLDEALYDDRDDFQTELTTALISPIEDPDSAAAVAPILVRGPAELLDSARLLSFARDFDDTAAEQRDELLERIANGLDLPRSTLRGVDNMNHWTAWLEDESTFKMHVDPVLIDVLNSFSYGVYQTFLEESGVPDWDQYVIWKDITSLVKNPNRFGDAILLFDRKAISEDALRREGGFDDEDAPDDDELEEREDEKTVVVEEDVTESDPESERGTPDSDNPAAASIQVLAQRRLERLAKRKAGLDLRADADQASRGISAAADPPREFRGEGLSQIDVGVSTRLHEAAQQIANRTLDRAGARARTKARKFRTLTQLIDGVPNREVTRILGPENMARLQVEDEELVTEEDVAEIAVLAAAMFQDAIDSSVSELEAEGIEVERDELEEQEDVDAASDLVKAGLLAWVLSQLFRRTEEEQRGEIPKNRVPTQIVWGGMTRAGGSAPSSTPPLTDNVRGIGNGARTTGWLREAGFITSAYEWIYGDPSARASAFDPHRRLNGERFQTWSDPVLATPGDASWLSTPFLYPGDHGGCLCTFERILIAEEVP